MYVTARVCLKNMLVHAGLLAAHQSIEILAKALMYLEPEFYYCAEEDDPSKKGMHRFWGHSLPDLIGKVTVHNANLDSILRDNALRAFLEELTRSYIAVRYGETGYSIQTDLTVQYLDKVFLALDTAYLEKIKGQKKSKILVPKPFRDSFLLDNATYLAGDISESPLANNPGSNPPELPLTKG